MREPRHDRELTPVRTIQIDPLNRDPAGYQRDYRKGGPLGACRPVQIRNGMPEVKPYVYRGVGHDVLECDCHA